ncbi:thioredoxin-dependent thiol peroxidase [bacterium]|nr:thioredoxin-dependent thiol peroxidase [bacterium]
MAKSQDPTTSELVGKKAPTFTLPDQNGKKRKLSDYKGQWVVLFAYPKDATPGCTKEACGFRDAAADFRKLGAQVLGISILDTASKKKFADKHGLSYPLLADEDHAVAEKYGFWKEKSMYGKKFMGINRETFVIDPEGKIAAHWQKASGNEAHSAEVLEWIKAKVE